MIEDGVLNAVTPRPLKKGSVLVKFKPPARKTYVLSEKVKPLSNWIQGRFSYLKCKSSAEIGQKTRRCLKGLTSRNHRKSVENLFVGIKFAYLIEETAILLSLRCDLRQ